MKTTESPATIKKSLVKTLCLSCCLIAAGLLVDVVFDTGLLVREVSARVGRPATPLSVAGVARRTTRRTIRRTSVMVATLPRGCRTVVVEGMALRQCGSTWYQPHGSQWMVVTVN